MGGVHRRFWGLGVLGEGHRQCWGPAGMVRGHPHSGEPQNSLPGLGCHLRGSAVTAVTVTDTGASTARSL